MYTSCFLVQFSHLQKYTDYPEVDGCIKDGQEAEYKQLVRRFIACCEKHNLEYEQNSS